MSYIEKEGIRFSSSTLEELEDTNISNPTSSDVLHYNGEKWENTTIGDAAYKDVSNAVTTGDNNLVTGDAVATAIDQLPDSLSELNDVSISEPQNGQSLVYADTEQKWVNDFSNPVAKSVSGNPITITDAASAPMVKCVTEIQGYQDLHGYDKPWVGGAGTNLLQPFTVSGTRGGVYYEQELDSGGNVIDYVLNNTSTGANSVIPYKFPIVNTEKTYYVSYFDTVIISQISRFVWDLTTSNTISITGDFTITIPANHDVGLGIYFQSGIAFNNYKLQAMVSEEPITSYSSYSNICPITAYTQGTISVGGHNVWNEMLELGSLRYTDGADVESTTTLRSTGYVDVKPNTEYYICSPVNNTMMLYAYQEDGTYIGAYNTASGGQWRKDGVAYANDKVVRMPANCTKIKFIIGSAYGTTYHYDVSINYPATYTSYAKYTGNTTHTTTYPSAIYRGSEDCVGGSVKCNSSVLALDGVTTGAKFTNKGTVTSVDDYYLIIPDAKTYGKQSVSITNEEAATYGLICSHAVYQAPVTLRDIISYRIYIGSGSTFQPRISFPLSMGIDTVEKANQWLTDQTNPVQITYELATPTTSSVTPTNLPIHTLSGYNHIESSTGDMKITYITKSQQPIIDLIDTKADNVDMIGATADESGSHGLVPTPAAGSQDMFLKGDGTWSNVPSDLPDVTSSDNGKVLSVVEGAWGKAAANSEIEVFYGSETTDGRFNLSNSKKASDVINAITSGKTVLLKGYVRGYYVYDGQRPYAGQTDAHTFTNVLVNNSSKYSLTTLYTSQGRLTYLNMQTLELGASPVVTSSDNDKIMKVVNGVWTKAAETKELPAVTSEDNGKVLGVTNGNWGVVEQSGGVDEDIIAPEYNPSETYNIADYCMYNGKMYKCNTANTTGAWDSAKWDETCVGDELTLKTTVIVAPRVDQTATYTYNGTEQTLAFEYINSNNTIVTGNKHTDAGTYTCTVSLKNPNDLWSDTMDNVDKTFTWTINKVTSSITLSPTTFYFSNGTPQTLTATVIGQPLVLSGYDTNLITITQVSVVSGVYTYNIKATGTAGTTTITASIAESTNYTAASATASVETEEFTPGATLVPWSTGTNKEITAMINSYYNGEITLEDVKSVWSIGDVRNVDISAMTATGVGESHRAQTVEMEILDFDHDTLTTPVGSITKALITVDMKNCLRDGNVTDTTGSSNTEHGYMNSNNTNVGGWTSCKRRTWCNNVFYNALPSYFKSLVKPVDKLTSAGNSSSTINTDSDYCFLLSEIEIFGSVTYSKAGEGSQYAWFANATANRYKLPKWDSRRVSDSWWERSPYGSSSIYFCIVYDDGYAHASGASSALGLAPACCL